MYTKALICCLMLTSPIMCMWNVKTISPATPGQDVWTICARLGAMSDEKTPTPIFNSDAVSYVISITTAGNYQLAENITYPLVITASRVFLDCNSYTITDTTANDYIITVTPGISEVGIYRGYIQNTGGAGTGAGIWIGSGDSKISVKDMTIIGCHHGVRVTGLSGTNNDVKDSDLTNLRLISNDVGLLLEYSSGAVVRSCHALYSAFSGFEAYNSQANCFYDCSTLKTTSTATALGFKLAHGTSNLLYRCVARQTITSSTTFGDSAVGFLLTGSEQKTKVSECIAGETDVVSSPTAVTSGIQLLPVFNGGLSSATTTTLVSASNIVGVHWSPDNKYVVEIDGSKASVNYWDGTTLSAVNNVTPGTTLGCVGWAPDGKYLALGESVTGAGATTLYVYTYNGLAFSGLVSVSLGANNHPAALEWAPNGKYIAVQGWNSSANQVYVTIYLFTGSALTSAVSSTAISVGSGYSISWSPDGQYIVIPGASNSIYVYKFYPDTALTSITSASTNMTGPVKCAWSPTGKYIAVGDTTGKATIFSFNGTTLTYVTQSGVIGGAGNLTALAWSPDGKYIVVGGAASPFPTRVYSFSGTALTQVGADQNATAANLAVLWSADGRYIARGEAVSGSSRLSLFNAMYGPTLCVVNSCNVADTQASSQNIGRGFVGGGSNMFSQNIGYNNGANFSYGIPNAYDGRFELLRNTTAPFDNLSLPIVF